MASELQEKEKLTWLGMKRAAQSLSEVKEEIEKLRDSVSGYDQFQQDLEDSVDSYADFEAYLQDKGWTQSETDAFIEKIRNNFESYTDFENYVIDQTSFDQLKSGFGSQNSMTSELESEEGGAAAGFRVFENGGVTKDGEPVPPGAVEIWGREVHFSQSPPTQAQKEALEYSNFRTNVDEGDVVDVYDEVVMRVDITNPNPFNIPVVLSLNEDGSTLKTRQVTLPESSTTTHSFRVMKTEHQCHDYDIQGEGEQLICWVPPGLVM